MTNPQTITKYAIREYKCPVCGNIEKHGTNHFGEIYCPCKKCKNSVLYCNEPEALEAREQRKQDKAVLTYYRFDISQPVQATQYKALCSQLQAQGLTKWDFVGLDRMTEMEQHNGKEVTIYDKDTFDNQYISDIGRLFNWKEQIYPNKKIKNGYYLTHI